MKLADWIAREGITRMEFARRVGLKHSSDITALCKGTQWVSRKMAQRIMEETRGDVTPTDFLRVEDAA